MNSSWEGMLPILDDVVIVQSDDILRDVMSEVFSDIGARVYAFSTADAALEHLIITSRPCALVVSDHSNPGRLQGLPFLELIHEKWPSVSAIFISSTKFEVSRLPAGSVLLLKPWCIDDLIGTAALLLQPSCTARRI